MLTLACCDMLAQTRALELPASRKQARNCVPVQTGSGAGITPDSGSHCRRNLQGVSKDTEPPKGTGYPAYPARERRPAADAWTWLGRSAGPITRSSPRRAHGWCSKKWRHKFYLGEHRGKTYQWVLDNRPDYIQWARQQVNPS